MLLCPTVQWLGWIPVPLYPHTHKKENERGTKPLKLVQHPQVGQNIVESQVAGTCQDKRILCRSGTRERGNEAQLPCPHLSAITGVGGGEDWQQIGSINTYPRELVPVTKQGTAVEEVESTHCFSQEQPGFRLLLPGTVNVNITLSPYPAALPAVAGGMLVVLQAHESGWRGPEQMRDPGIGTPIFRKKPSSN